MRSTSTSFNFDDGTASDNNARLHAGICEGYATPNYLHKLHVHIYTSTVLSFFFPSGHSLLVGAGEDRTCVG